MTLRTFGLVLQIHIATLWAHDDVTSYFDAASRANWCFVANSVSTFRTFNHCHIFVSFLFYFVILFYLISHLALVTYLSQAMFTHKTALVYISVDAVDASFTRILPHGNVAIVDEFWFARGVLCNH